MFGEQDNPAEHKPSASTVDALRKVVAVFAANLAASSWLHIITLTGLVWICFGSSIHSFFLADDIPQIEYASRIVGGKWNLLYSLFSSNYIWGPLMVFYRPMLMVTFVIDFCFWRTNAVGYHVTSILFYTGDVLVCYLIGRILYREWACFEPALAAFLAAALFAVSPLHSESVCWLSGRTDVISGFFSLLAFYFMLESRVRSRARNVCLAAGSLFIGLLVKEMALVVPVVVTAWHLLGSDNSAEAGGGRLRTGLKRAIWFSLPLWLTLLAYLVIRTQALGTLIGGYSLDIRRLSALYPIESTNFCQTIIKLLFPFSTCAFRLPNALSVILAACYLGLIAIAGLRLARKEFTGKGLVFLAFWMLISIVPLLPLWGIKPTLEHSRWFFFFTVPLSLLWPVLVFQSSKADSPDNTNARRRGFLSASGCALLLIMAAAFQQAAAAHNQIYCQAGSEVKRLMEASQALARTVPPGKRAVVLGIPLERRGVQVLLSALNFRFLLEPPFTEKALSSRLVNMQPVFLGLEDQTDPTYLKARLADPRVIAALVWAGPDQGFVPLQLKADFAAPEVRLLCCERSFRSKCSVSGDSSWRLDAGAVKLDDVGQDVRLKLEALQLNPLDYDFLEFSVLTAPFDGPAEIEACWQGTGPVSEQGLKPSSSGLDVNDQANSCSHNRNRALAFLTASARPGYRQVRIHLSHYWRWYACRTITELELHFFPCKHIEIKDVQLLKDTHLMPLIGLQPTIFCEPGFYAMPDGPFLVFVSAANVPEAIGARMEISRGNCAFECSRPQEKDPALGSVMFQPMLASFFAVDPTWFGGRTWCQVRARAIGRDGLPVGEYSDPLNLYRLTPEDLKSR